MGRGEARGHFTALSWLTFAFAAVAPAALRRVAWWGGPAWAGPSPRVATLGSAGLCLSVGLLWLLKRGRERPSAPEGLRWLLGLAGVVVAVAVAMGASIGPGNLDAVGKALLGHWWIGVAVLGVAISEECFFRGVLPARTLRRLSAGRGRAERLVLAGVVSQSLFVAAHLPSVMPPLVAGSVTAHDLAAQIAFVAAFGSMMFAGATLGVTLSELTAIHVGVDVVLWAAAEGFPSAVLRTLYISIAGGAIAIVVRGRASRPAWEGW